MTLLGQLDEKKSSEYFKSVIGRLHGGCAVIVRQTADGRGRGLFAVQDIKAGELILSEAPLVAEQHTSSRSEAMVCGRCFRYLGSIELQAAWLLRHHPGIPREIIRKLQSGSKMLPYSEQYPLPSLVACRGRCDELYCSKNCADADWEEHHNLLCVGNETQLGDEKLQALNEFRQHAEATNDIFLLAGKVLARVLTEVRAQPKTASGPSAEERQKALQAAWTPFAAGWKKVWWECVATPEDVDDESAFREELKTLALESLELLSKALDDRCSPDLFNLDLYGSIVGMFELNNLGLVVPSPLLQWFDTIRHPVLAGADSSLDGHDLLESILEPLGELLETSSACDGTAFYALQSCINHSCSPNADTSKGEEHIDGAAVITAKAAIAAGEEITISYIDEEMSLAERQAALLDYGFKCQCERCLCKSR